MITCGEIQEKLNRYDSGYTLISADYQNVHEGNLVFKCNRCGVIHKRSIGVIYKKENSRICNECRIMDYKIKITGCFPYIIGDEIYTLIDDVQYCQDKRTYLLSIQDKAGYRYKVEFNKLTGESQTRKFARFFKHNPFTKYNIELFFVKNNIVDLQLAEDISELRAIDPIMFKIGGKICKIRWNDIISCPQRYDSNHISEYVSHLFAKELTKDEVIDIIYKMYEKKKSPLHSEDFIGEASSSHISIRMIEKYFGSLTAMQQDLGLPVTSERKVLSDDELLMDICEVCNKVEEFENRKLITSHDFKKYSKYGDIYRYLIRCKELGTTLRKYINNCGFEYQKSGVGMNYIFSDGECVVSRYEYDFSLYLRDNGYEYNVTYFKDIPYSKIDENYCGKMTCDYCVSINGKSIYFELAGILGNIEYQQAYLSNTTIKSKSKEEYRQKLNHKKEIFEQNNLEYFILLPTDMAIDNYKRIFEKYEKKTA